MTANLSAMNLLLATRNQRKTREFTQLLGPNFTLRDLTRARDLPEIRETGRAFEDNAVIKAIAISKVFPHEMVIADDSGLEVDALNGAPGIFSARYAGTGADDAANNAKLLSALAGIPPERRRARYRCALVMVFAPSDAAPLIAEGVWEGSILESPRGSGGSTEERRSRVRRRAAGRC